MGRLEHELFCQSTLSSLKVIGWVGADVILVSALGPNPSFFLFGGTFIQRRGLVGQQLGLGLRPGLDNSRLLCYLSFTFWWSHHYESVVSRKGSWPLFWMTLLPLTGDRHRCRRLRRTPSHWATSPRLAANSSAGQGQTRDTHCLAKFIELSLLDKSKVTVSYQHNSWGLN